jgi:hypothetical protein
VVCCAHTFQIACRRRVNVLIYITNVCLEHGSNQMIRTELAIPSEYAVEKFKESIKNNKWSTWRWSRVELHNCMERKTRGLWTCLWQHYEIVWKNPSSAFWLNKNQNAILHLKLRMKINSWGASFEHCLPLIAFDACTIRNSYEGVILACYTVNGTGQIMPLAYAIASIEETNNWNWLMLTMTVGIKAVQQSTQG